MPNISGNFDTDEEEKAVVKVYLQEMGYNPNECVVEKNGGDNCTDRSKRDAGDVEATLPDGRKILFEVKQESYYRFSNWGQLGIDFISEFDFKPGCYFDSKVHRPRDFERFMATVDCNAPNFKWGKIKYSTSDVWLFYVKNPDGTYHFMEGYDYARIREDRMVDYLSANCEFARNSKNANQLSRTDTWKSAVFYADPDIFEDYLITPEIFAQLGK